MINVSWDEKRLISVSPSRKLSAKGDSRSQRVVFTLGRYLDSGLDLTSCTAAIATTNREGSTNLIMLDIKDAGDRISLVLEVTKKLTRVSGALKYQLIFTNPDADMVFKTAPDYFEIYDSIDASEDISEDYPSVIEQISDIFEKTKEISAIAVNTSDSMKNEVNKARAEAENAASYANETIKQILLEKESGLFKGDAGETGKRGAGLFAVSGPPLISPYTELNEGYTLSFEQSIFGEPLREGDYILYTGEDIYSIPVGNTDFIINFSSYSVWKVVYVKGDYVYIYDVREGLTALNGFVCIIKGANGRGISSIAKTDGSGSLGSIDTYTITYTDNTTGTFTLKNGEHGATFTPHISSDGMLSWTNDRDLLNPEAVNIKGPKGDKGEDGATGSLGPQGPKGDKGEDGATFIPSVSSDGILSWTNDKGLSNPANIKLNGGSGKLTLVNSVIPAGRMRGDINGDGVIDNTDLNLISNGTGSLGTRYLGTVLSSAFPESNIPQDYLAADVNGDGQITANDADIISYIIGIGGKTGAYGAEITGNWTNNPLASTQKEQFYTDITVEGMTAQDSAVVIVSSSENMTTNNAIFPKAECMNEALRLYALSCPTEEVPCMILYASGNGTALVLQEKLPFNIALKDELPAANIIVTDASVTQWTPDSTYEDYPYCGRFDIEGVTSTHIPNVTFSVDDALSGNYAPAAKCADGYIEIYAKVNTNITIPSIVCMS